MEVYSKCFGIYLKVPAMHLWAFWEIQDGVQDGRQKRVIITINGVCKYFNVIWCEWTLWILRKPNSSFSFVYQCFGRHNIQYGGKHSPKMAKFHCKNLLPYRNVVVTKIAWFCQSMTYMHTQWRAYNILGIICFLSNSGIHTLIRTIIYIWINFCSFMFCNYVIFVYIVFA